MILVLFSGLLVAFPLCAEQKMSREDYVARSHDDLLAPCKNDEFVQCLGTT